MSKVYITDYIDSPDLELETLGRELARVPSTDVEVLLVWHEHINAEYIAQFPNLRGVVRYGVGYDNLDLELLSSKGIVACNTPDYGTEEVSDTALAMALNITRGLSRYDYLSRSYKSGWQENTLPHIRRTSEVKLGVIGAGRIGGRCLLKAKGVGFQTQFHDPFLRSGYDKVFGATCIDSLDELLSTSDIISIHTPLTEATRGMVDATFLGKMKRGASIINTARGPIVKDLDVIYDALKSDDLLSVALDVLPQEPPQDGRLIKAWRERDEWLDGRFFINPHSAYYSSTSYAEMRTKAASNALRIINGEVAKNVVN